MLTHLCHTNFHLCSWTLCQTQPIQIVESNAKIPNMWIKEKHVHRHCSVCWKNKTQPYMPSYGWNNGPRRELLSGFSRCSYRLLTSTLLLLGLLQMSLTVIEIGFSFSFPGAFHNDIKPIEDIELKYPWSQTCPEHLRKLSVILAFIRLCMRAKQPSAKKYFKLSSYFDWGKLRLSMWTYLAKLFWWSWG